MPALIRKVNGKAWIQSTQSFVVMLSSLKNGINNCTLPICLLILEPLDQSNAIIAQQC